MIVVTDNWSVAQQLNNYRYFALYPRPYWARVYGWIAKELEIIAAPSFDGKKLSATQISVHFKLSSQKINQILDELGWINKAVKGWKVSQSGSRLGGVQKEDSRTGVPYVIWDETVLKNGSLQHSVNEITGINAEVKSTDNSVSNFRQKFEHSACAISPF